MDISIAYDYVDHNCSSICCLFVNDFLRNSKKILTRTIPSWYNSILKKTREVNFQLHLYPQQLLHSFEPIFSRQFNILRTFSDTYKVTT